MKIALISDLHLEFRSDGDIEALLETLNNLTDDVDVLLNAGDLHPDAAKREAFRERLKLKDKYHFICGNHDFYGQQTIESDLFACQVGPEPVQLAACSLWTDFNKGDPNSIFMFRMILNDARQIKPAVPTSTGMGRHLADQLYYIHNQHSKFIFEETKPTIVMTHHAPSFGSCHERYKNDTLTNSYFCSDLSEKILNAPNIKLWVHGHVHDPFDYMLGGCRVVCNPLGYPGEKYKSILDYAPKFIIM